jgi:Zn-dependent protease
LNLIPVPPLDGAHILANFSSRFRELIDNMSPQTTIIAIVVLFGVLSYSSVGLFTVAAEAGSWYLNLLVT